MVTHFLFLRKTWGQLDPADIDVLVAMSNCPQERNKCNGFQPTPMREIHYGPE